MPLHNEQLIRELIAEYLGFSGYEVISAESPRRAIELLEGGALQAVRLVISDVLMPGLSGVELIRILAARLPGVKLLLMSGFPGQSPCEEIAIDPSTPYLEKPFTMEALAARVRRVRSRSLGATVDRSA